MLQSSNQTRKSNQRMDKSDIQYSSGVLQSATKNYRRVTISRRYWEECGRPNVADPLFKKCVFIGYGACAIRLAMCGLDSRLEDIHLTAEFMGYNEGSFEVSVKE